MQVSKINTTIPKQQTNKDFGRNKVNLSKPQNTPSFKGGVDTFCLKLAELIEYGGLAVSFTIQDMVGTNAPRPIMGLMRNKKENKGEKNFKFAAKELVREMLTGPSMFVIPMLMFKGGSKAFGKSINVPAKFIKSFSEIHAAQPLNEMGNAITKQEFYKNTFAEMIKNAKAEKEITKETLATAEDFAERYLNGELAQRRFKQGFFEKIKTTFDVKKKQTTPLEKTIIELSDDFVNITKKHAKDAAHTDFTIAKLSNSTADSFSDVVKHMTSYADDIVKKAQKQSPDKLNQFIKNLSNKKVVGRFAANAVIYACIVMFLQLIPKLYNKAEGEGNSGLKGLMKEETLNDKSLDKPQNKEVNNNQNNKANANKSNPSFGSASLASKITGSGIAGKIAKTMEFQGCNVSFPMLLGLMGLGVLLPRTRQAKDKYDKEEILRRDLVTCATMCFAEKELQKGFSKLNETKSGFVLAAKDASFKDKTVLQKFFEYIRPINGVKVMSSNQIISKYSGIDKYKDGIKGFCDFISGQGGNLSKVLSLTDESKSLVESLLQKEGTSLAQADNKVITDILDKAKDSEEVKKLVDLFKNKDNAWIKKARTLNARFTTLSVLVLVPIFLGFLLPAINERATKKRIEKEKSLEQTNKQQNTPTLTQDLLPQKNIFSDMTKYVK